MDLRGEVNGAFIFQLWLVVLMQFEIRYFVMVLYLVCRRDDKVF